MNQPPWDLLELRTTPKQDLRDSFAELLYGSTITVPGDFIAQATDAAVHTAFIRCLRTVVAALRRVLAMRHGRRRNQIPRSLDRADYVFIRHDSHHGLLSRVYDGPFGVIQQSPKTFRLDIDGKEDVFFIDRLKACQVDPATPVQIALPPRRAAVPTQRPTKNNAEPRIALFDS